MRGLKQSSPTTPVASVLLGGSEGEQRFDGSSMFTNPSTPGFELPLCRAEQSDVHAGFRRGLFEGRARFLRGQVPQAPRGHRAAQEQSGIGVPFSLVTFSWASKRK